MSLVTCSNHSKHHKDCPECIVKRRAYQKAYKAGVRVGRKKSQETIDRDELFRRMNEIGRRLCP